MIKEGDALYRLKECAPYDSKGTIRTASDWNDRYMIDPSERSDSFEKVKGGLE